MKGKLIPTSNSEACKYQNSENGLWLQLNVGLIRHDGDALPSARILFSRLDSLVSQSRCDGWLGGFFFMRKPPDIRLRFLMVAHFQQALKELSEQMLALQRQGSINQFFFSNYQPENNRFGGLEAMKHIHQYFDADTCIWLEIDRLCQQEQRVTPAEIFLPIVFHDLFNRVLRNDVSVLQTWYKLGALIPALPKAAIPFIHEPFSIEILCSRLAVEAKEADILYRYTKANNTLAEALVYLYRTNQLTCDLLDILVAVAMFNFNRYGFSGEHSGVLIKATIQTLEQRMSGINFLVSPW